MSVLRGAYFFDIFSIFTVSVRHGYSQKSPLLQIAKAFRERYRAFCKRKMWVWLYREDGSRKYVTLGPSHKMTKAQAEKKRDEALAETRARQASSPDPDIVFGQFLDGVVLPFYRSKWKSSTASTSESRMTHCFAEFKKMPLKAITLKSLQAFLGR